MQYISSHFDQSGDGLEFINQHGGEAWLDMLGGALDLLEGEEHDTPPWGSLDTLVYEEPLDAANAAGRGENRLAVHVNYSLGYASITAILED